MRGNPLSKKFLLREYIMKKKSSHQIAASLGCSIRKVDYWLEKHYIRKRSISDAVYARKNPSGDPFHFKKPKSNEEWFLFGMGLGLYWGEGTKKNLTAVRLGNTDPALIRKFLEFLYQTYSVKKEKVRFGLQIFSDMKPGEALAFWCRHLNATRKQFGKVIVTPARGLGTYRSKTLHGVITVYISNTKLRNELNRQIELMR